MSLYQVLDVLEEDLGCERVLLARRWQPAERIGLFTHTANNYRALGLAARHGPTDWEPPTDPMTLGEAKQVIGGLLQQWLKHKAAP